jgi:hypothetical protein
LDASRISFGERIAAASGAALFVLLFVSWIDGENAWELFSIVHVLLALLALTAVALPLAKAVGAEPPLRPSNRTILTRVGVVALVLILAYFLEAFSSAQVGLWLALLAAVALLYGAATMPDDETSSRRRDRTRRPRAAEDFEQPPPGMQSWREGARFGDEGEGEGDEPGAARSARVGDRARDPDAGAWAPSPRAEDDEPPRREPSSRPDEPPEERDPGGTEVRGPRRPPEVPPSPGR